MLYATTPSRQPRANLDTDTPPPDLAAHHRRELESGSGISAAVVAQRGYRSVTDPAELRRLGFAPNQCRPGLLIPLWTTAGVGRGWMLKADTPRSDAGGGGNQV
jgi:hypothetical protein